MTYDVTTNEVFLYLSYIEEWENFITITILIIIIMDYNLAKNDTPADSAVCLLLQPRDVRENPVELQIELVVVVAEDVLGRLVYLSENPLLLEAPRQIEELLHQPHDDLRVWLDLDRLHRLNLQVLVVQLQKLEDLVELCQN